MRFTVRTQPQKEKLLYFLRFHKNRIVLTGLFLMFLFCGISITCCMGPDAFGLRQKANSMANTVFEPFDTTELAVSFDNANDITIGGVSYPIGTVVTPLYGVIRSFGLSLTMLLWCISLGTAFLNGSAYKEILIKRFLVLFLTIVCVANASPIAETICNIGSELVGKVGTYTAAETPASLTIFSEDTTDFDQSVAGYEQEIEDLLQAELSMLPAGFHPLDKLWINIKYGVKKFLAPLSFEMKYNLGDPLLVILALFLPWVIKPILSALVTVAVLARGIEIVLLCCFAPIPFALVGDGHFGSGAGARFLKNMGAIALQGAVMLAIMYICRAMMTTAIAAVDTSSVSEMGAEGIDSYIEIVFSVLAIQVINVLLLFRSQSIAQKLFGLA